MCSSLSAHLIVRDLLQVQMGGVDDLHAGVAVICAAESTPVFGVRVELVGLLPAALRVEHMVIKSISSHHSLSSAGGEPRASLGLLPQDPV